MQTAEFPGSVLFVGLKLKLWPLKLGIHVIFRKD